MQTTEDNLIYTERVRSLVETILIQSEKRFPTGELSGVLLEVEQYFKKILRIATFINDRLTRIDYKDLHPSPVNEHRSKEPQTSLVYGIDRDHSFDTLGVKQETVDADYDIDNIFNDLNAIFDATIFDRVDQEEEDPLESTFVIEQEHDVEQLLVEDPTEQIEVDMPESAVVSDSQEYDVFLSKPKAISSIRKFRLKSSVERNIVRQIQCEKCSFVTSNIRCLHKHMRKEHIDLEYFCPFCEYIADKKRMIRSHVNRQHPAQNCQFAF